MNTTTTLTATLVATPATFSSPTKHILRLPAVMAKTGMSRSWIYAAIKEGKFPKSIKLGDAAVGWLESDIDAWIAERQYITHVGN